MFLMETFERNDCLLNTAKARLCELLLEREVAHLDNPDGLIAPKLNATIVEAQYILTGAK